MLVQKSNRQDVKNVKTTGRAAQYEGDSVFLLSRRVVAIDEQNFSLPLGLAAAPLRYRKGLQKNSRSEAFVRASENPHFRSCKKTRFLIESF